MDLIDRLMAKLRGVLAAEIQGIAAPAAQGDAAQRAMTVDAIYSELYDWGYDQTFPFYVANLYIEDGGLFALFGRDGRLFRAEILIENNAVRIGEMVEVQQEFAPVERSSGLTLRELPNGNIRFFMVACTAVVNRVGEIDSTTLFDNMIQRANELDFYPRVDVYHLGSVDPAFEFGQIDLLARDGVSYIASGELDGSHPVTAAIMKQYRTNPKALGASIEYFPVDGAFEDMDIGNGATVRAFTDGINTRISILFEKDAASWFTSLVTEETNRMKRRTLDAATKARLKDLFGGDEDAFNTFLAGVGEVTRQVEDLGLVHRTGDQAAADAAAAPAADAAQTQTIEQVSELTQTIELDDQAIALIAAEVVRQIGDQHFAPINQAIAANNEQIAQLAQRVDQVATTQDQVAQRVGRLETDEETQRQQWLADLPAGRRPSIQVVARPRVERQVADPAAPAAQPNAQTTLADVAAETLAALPKPPSRRI